MEVKTPQELNLTQEKGMAWLQKTQKVPLRSLLLAVSASGTPCGEEGPPALRTWGWLEPFQPTNTIFQEPQTHPQFRDTASRTEPPRDTRDETHYKLHLPALNLLLPCIKCMKTLEKYA